MTDDQREEREITNLTQAMQLLDEWIAAYEELRRANVQLMHRYIKLQRSLEHANTALDNWEFLAEIDGHVARAAEAELDPFE